MCKNDELCVKCGKNPLYEYKGKTYRLCSECGWEALIVFIWDGGSFDEEELPYHTETSTDLITTLLDGISNMNSTEIGKIDRFLVEAEYDPNELEEV